MFNIVKQGDKTTAYVTQYVADTAADIDSLPINCAPGSTCLIIETSEKYMLNNNYEWKKISTGSGGGSSSSEISNIYLEDGQLIFQFKDGSSINAGKLPASVVLVNSIEELPEVGDTSVLYIIGTSVYMWTGSEYVKPSVGSADTADNVQWGSF